ncbi:hypothetical protein E4U40_007539, partial [Claviceps sp. LM458 group G5]
EYFTRRMQEELDAHPELQELESGGSKAGSMAPSGPGESTSQASGTRIKIISSGARGSDVPANGVRLAGPSDGE